MRASGGKKGSDRGAGSVFAWVLLGIAAALGVWSAMWADNAIEQKARLERDIRAEAAREDSEATLAWAKDAAEKALTLTGKDFPGSVESSRGLFEPEAFIRWEAGLRSLGMRSALEASGARMRTSVIRLESVGRESESERFPFEGCALAQAERGGEVVAKGWIVIRGSASGAKEAIRLSELEARKGADGCEMPADYLTGNP